MKPIKGEERAAGHTPTPWMSGTYEATDAFRAIKEHECICREDGSLVAVFGPKGDAQSVIDRDAVGVAVNSFDALKKKNEELGWLLKSARHYVQTAWDETKGTEREGTAVGAAFMLKQIDAALAPSSGSNLETAKANENLGEGRDGNA